MSLPTLESSAAGCAAAEVLLAVYAPFGSDSVLSAFPGDASSVVDHPLVKNLSKVAACGVHVVALIDRFADDTYLVEIGAGSSIGLDVVSRWKQDMSAPNNLAGFLRYAASRHPHARIVLALEGHGAGFVPDIDRSQLTPAKVTEDGAFEWRIRADTSAPVDGSGAPVLPGGFPQLPGGFPQLPTEHMPLSTFGLGAALKSALSCGVPRLSVIHFNNCFNMSVELLHTVAPYAEHATGYINYNFFTAGAAYPPVFERLRLQGSATAAELSIWLAKANGDYLAAQKHHPTVGCAVDLSRMAGIAERLHELSEALLSFLPTSGGRRADAIKAIRGAIVRAQQLDISGDMELETPDEMTDLLSLADQLRHADFAGSPVPDKAGLLVDALSQAKIKQYGATDQPWTAPAGLWDFSSKFLAMNVFLPDPLLRGVWDWRSPYYMEPTPTPAQPNIIDFLQATRAWVKFLVEYHRDVRFVGLLPARIPPFPVFNRDSDKIDYPHPPKPCRPGHEPPKK